MVQTLSVFDVGLVMTAILALATMAMWPLGGLRKPKSVSHCTYCDYDSARQQAGPCSECGKLTGVASRSRRGRVAWRLRWVLPAIIAGGWFTIETRHQGHAWWLLPNWAVIGLHDVVGAGVSRPLDSEFRLALIEHSMGITDGNRLFESLRLPPALRAHWPIGIEPVSPGSGMNIHSDHFDSRGEVRLPPHIAPVVLGHANLVPSESWQSIYRPPSHLRLNADGSKAEAVVQITGPLDSQGRRTLFNGFTRPPLKLTPSALFTSAIERVASIDSLVTPMSGSKFDNAVLAALGLRAVIIPGRSWAVVLRQGPIHDSVAGVTIGVRLELTSKGKPLAQARWVVRLGIPGQSESLGPSSLDWIALYDSRNEFFDRDLAQYEELRFILSTDESMVLADPHATRYWRGRIELDASELVPAFPRQHRTP